MLNEELMAGSEKFFIHAYKQQYNYYAFRFHEI